MEECSSIEMAPINGETPFADHLGETVLAVREEEDPDSGRLSVCPPGDPHASAGRIRVRSLR
jgi:hypothetical protein